MPSVPNPADVDSVASKRRSSTNEPARASA
jgi:hypothetical protein